MAATHKHFLGLFPCFLSLFVLLTLAWVERTNSGIIHHTEGDFVKYIMKYAFISSLDLSSAYPMSIFKYFSRKQSEKVPKQHHVSIIFGI